jgi:hypothetical protein
MAELERQAKDLLADTYRVKVVVLDATWLKC